VNLTKDPIQRELRAIEQIDELYFLNSEYTAMDILGTELASGPRNC
jgi:hypothetical protein